MKIELEEQGQTCKRFCDSDWQFRFLVLCMCPSYKGWVGTRGGELTFWQNYQVELKNIVNARGPQGSLPIVCSGVKLMSNLSKHIVDLSINYFRTEEDGMKRDFYANEFIINCILRKERVKKKRKLKGYHTFLPMWYELVYNR